jgi:VIT1/CCC1 family predicted Fe2+/Mn2+ transporter
MILSEFIYGGMDGIITTAAIIAGILGANISTKYALVLGMANLCADGFSMGISRYNSLIDIATSKVSPLLSGIATFFSFVIMGAIPLIPFVFVSYLNENTMKKMLLIFSFIAFFIMGLIKGIYSKKVFKSLTEIIIIGSIGVFISFQVSKYVKGHVHRL